MSRLRYAAGGVATCLLVASCGTSPTISSGAGNTLRADVYTLTQAVAARQWSAADAALAQLRGDLTAAAAANDVSAQRAQSIRADIASVAADLAARRTALTPTTPTSSSSPSKPTPPPKPPKHRDHGRGHRHGHGGDGGD